MSDNGNTGLGSPELAADETLRQVAGGAATLAKGSRGEGVRILQQALTTLGTPMTADGSFGPKTGAAISALQAAEGLPQTGVVDAATLAALDKRLTQKSASSLHDAMAKAAGLSPDQVAAMKQNTQAAAPAAPAAPSRNDVAFFTDSKDLQGLTPGAVADPDTPPPAADSVGDKAAGAQGALPADRSALFDEVRRAISGDEPALAALDRLLASGRLHAGALLPNLAAMARGRRDPKLVLEGGIDPHALLAQAIRHVDNPLRVKQGAGHGTCGAGTMMYVMLRLDPAEFVRILDGITQETSQVNLRSGRTLKMPRNAIPRDESGRVDIDRLLQSALMNHATAMSWIFDYDNPNDNDSFWAAIGGDTRVPLGNFTSLFQDVMGGSYASVSSVDDVLKAMGAGEKVPVIMKWGTGYHWVSVEKIERGGDGKPASVILRNPWGRDSCAGLPPRTVVPEGGGRFRMKYADFVENLHGATIKG
ncbi:peptidoglycan-binding domain-containing protein [Polyangium aurulentum]|uniref:peptidoglycan-binding domain-containing protein n=1 Tax=Polyangium aurulentum TaxID=2567896 RepID=UPI0010AE4890|nr:peptidoglycan-binding domain-containing protein [Polyangium aurulentum]UQA57220.1 peptidoglycan-binding protein [Polyangium aurulentum]